MRLIKTEDAVGHVLCHDMTQIIKDQYKDARFRKGHVVTEEDIPVLLEAARVSRLPIMIYTDDALVLDAVLLRFPGRLLVDSLCEIERDLLEDIALHFGAILF